MNGKNWQSVMEGEVGIQLNTLPPKTYAVSVFFVWVLAPVELFFSS